MAVPKDLEEAYAALEELVERVAADRVRDEVLPEEVDAWRREDCRGAAILCDAAVNALRYELAGLGLETLDQAEIPGDAQRLLGALARVEAVLNPPAAQAEGPEARIVEVALPEAMLARMPGGHGRGFRMGELQMIFEASKLPNGVTNAHLSVSHPNRYPTWDELLRARHAPGGKTPNLWAWLPKPGEGPQTGPHTVHLWVVPPEELLG